MANFGAKHYVQIARTLNRAARTIDHDLNNIHKAIVIELADMFEADNSKFDRQRFLNYCTVWQLEGNNHDT